MYSASDVRARVAEGADCLLLPLLLLRENSDPGRHDEGSPCTAFPQGLRLLWKYCEFLHALQLHEKE
jgi:hypothetical protein